MIFEIDWTNKYGLNIIIMSRRFQNLFTYSFRLFNMSSGVNFSRNTVKRIKQSELQLNCTIHKINSSLAESLHEIDHTVRVIEQERTQSKGEFQPYYLRRRHSIEHSIEHSESDSVPSPSSEREPVALGVTRYKWIDRHLSVPQPPKSRWRPRIAWENVTLVHTGVFPGKASIKRSTPAVVSPSSTISAEWNLGETRYPWVSVSRIPTTSTLTEETLLARMAFIVVCAAWNTSSRTGSQRAYDSYLLQVWHQLMREKKTKNRNWRSGSRR